MGVIGKHGPAGNRLGAIHYPVIAAQIRPMHAYQRFDLLIAFEELLITIGIALCLWWNDEGAFAWVGRQQLAHLLFPQSGEEFGTQEL